MTRSLRAFVVALALILALTCAGSALAQIDSYSALLEAVSQAHDGDVLIISGVISPCAAMRASSSAARKTAPPGWWACASIP